MANDGFLYFTANQNERIPIYQKDLSDLRVQPYYIYRIKIDGTRITQPAPNQ